MYQFCVTTRQWPSDPGAGGALAPGRRVCGGGGGKSTVNLPNEKKSGELAQGSLFVAHETMRVMKNTLDRLHQEMKKKFTRLKVLVFCWTWHI